MRTRLTSVALVAGGMLISVPPMAEATLPGRNGPIFVSRFIKDRGVTQPPLYGLVSVRPDGTGLRSIELEAKTPGFSSKGRRLAYSKDGHLYVSRPDGSGAKRVVRGQYPSWAPDGRQIAYFDAHLDDNFSGRTVGVIDLRTRATRTLPIIPGPAAWSPKGDWIAYIDGGSSGPSVISRVRPDGSGREVVWKDCCNPLSGLDFSPDGRRLAFFRSDGDGMRLEVVSIKGGASRLVTRRTGRYAHEIAGISWSPDGKRIAYAAPAPSDTFYRFDLFRVSAKGGKPRVVLTNAREPAWQPR